MVSHLYFILLFFFFVEPACGEGDIVVTISLYVRALCTRALCVRPSKSVRAITYAFMHEFQNNLAQLFSLGSRSAI